MLIIANEVLVAISPNGIESKLRPGPRGTASGALVADTASAIRLTSIFANLLSFSFQCRRYWWLVTTIKVEPSNQNPSITTFGKLTIDPLPTDDIWATTNQV
jgi:hypothetical protein